MNRQVHSFTQENFHKKMDIHQGDCVQLESLKELFQVIGVDDKHKRCWVRRWPLLPKGSPVFEVSTKQITFSSARAA